MKTSANLKKAGDATMDLDAAFTRQGYPAQDLEQCGLAGPVGTDYTDPLTLKDVEADITQSPELARFGTSLRGLYLGHCVVCRSVASEKPINSSCQTITQREVAGSLIDSVELPKVLHS